MLAVLLVERTQVDKQVFQLFRIADHVRLLSYTPVGDQVGTACGLFCFFGVCKHLRPNIMAERDDAITVSNVLMNGETFEAIDTAFPLFQIFSLEKEEIYAII